MERKRELKLHLLAEGGKVVPMRRTDQYRRSRRQEITLELDGLLARLRRVRDHPSVTDQGPLATSRIWKAEMQISKLRQDLIDTAGAIAPDLGAGEPLRANKRAIRRLYTNTPRTPNTHPGNTAPRTNRPKWPYGSKSQAPR